MENFTAVTIDHDDPERLLNEHVAALAVRGHGAALLLVQYRFKPYWLGVDAEALALGALYFLSLGPAGPQLKVAVSSAPEVLLTALKQAELVPSEGGYQQFCRNQGLPTFSPEAMLMLSPVAIPKPWGQEIWYTGIEQRGVANACSGGLLTPLPLLLSALPRGFCNRRQQSLVLLKTLDPLADRDRGDLYFELHQYKREVYVVTAIDAQCWPEGRGAIRFGCDQEQRRQYPDDGQFRAAFLAAIKAYENVRRKLDNDHGESAEAIDVTLAQRDQWRAEEVRLRGIMESFSASLSLGLGDVVKVPCLTPHSLQHGVRTIEFQTPVYERLIISFNQQVQTQGHWDSEAAMALMNLESVVQEASVTLMDEAGLTVQRIVAFDDFEVLRVHLSVGRDFRPVDIVDYCLLVAITGELSVAGESLLPEQAALLAAASNGIEITPARGESACFLLAYPK
ncbi:MAG: hypothetical protein ACI9WS_002891 [Paraglaciecola psychrophila]|jgi:hypothetical protein